jgi:hypothetical protein
MGNSLSDPKDLLIQFPVTDPLGAQGLLRIADHSPSEWPIFSRQSTPDIGRAESVVLS